jgi:hypothetical protein
MKELLERWARLEPERCERMGEAEFYLTSTSHLFVINFQDKRAGPQLISALVQTAVQEALKERDWFWQLMRLGNAGRKVYAQVSWKASEPDKANAQYTNSWGEEEATTLLEVYLMALEAQ